MNPPIQLKRTTSLLLIVLGFVWLGLLPKAQAVSPAPDGGYPGQNTAEGQSALLHLSGGTYNTAVGWSSLGYNVTGSLNTAVGAGALVGNTADQNTAIGAGVLLSNTTGSWNTGTGALALLSNTTGSDNTALGHAALFANTTGSENTGVGQAALADNTIGAYDTDIGYAALVDNTTGNYNTAAGVNALVSNTTGFENTAVGNDALGLNGTGYDNTAAGRGALTFGTGNFNNAFGRNALHSITSGDGNVAVGDSALANATACENNVAIGNSALANSVVGNFNIALGFFAAQNTNGSNNIVIGNGGVAAEDGTIRIGDPAVQTSTYIAGISAGTVMSGATVLVGSDGHLGTINSSARFKDQIKPMDKASEAILALKPVTFCYKRELDPQATPQFGLVAEEVEKVNRDLVARDKEGKPYSVRYDQVNAMLLNEFLKAHRKMEKQGATIANQQKQIDALTRGLQKVSAQLEVSRPAPQVTKNNQ